MTPDTLPALASDDLQRVGRLPSPVTIVGLLLIGLLGVVLILFLIFPFEGTSPSTPAALLQAQMRAGLNTLIPFIVVALLGGAVAVAELAATFSAFPREALQTRWAQILILINVVAAILALVIARITMPTANPVLLVLSVGIGFQALIRTRFILAKQVGGSGDKDGEVSLNLGWLYDQFQHLCRTQIDLELMNRRRTAVTRMLEYYPTLRELYEVARYTITARSTLSPDEEQTLLAELEKLINPAAPEQFAKASIALIILENGGLAYVDLLLMQAMGTARNGLVRRPANPEEVVSHLVENYSLERLVALAEQITDVEKVRDWVRNAARPSESTDETSQKAAIGYFLVQQVGLEAVQRAVGLQTSGSPTEQGDKVTA